MKGAIIIMEVILRKDKEKLGKAGEVISVKEGYARNFLIPQGLALINTPQNKKVCENEAKQAKQKEMREIKISEKVVSKLEDISCTVSVKVGENDKMFGSVTSADISEALKIHDIDIDKKHIILEKPIKELGAYTVEVKVHSGVTGKLKVWVVKE